MENPILFFETLLPVQIAEKNQASTMFLFSKSYNLLSLILFWYGQSLRTYKYKKRC